MVSIAQKKELARQLAIHGDWNLAGKALGLTAKQIYNLKKSDPTIQQSAAAILEKTQAADVNAAVERFRETQKMLADEMAGGNMAVASALVKTHEMEFKRHGLFEKDNNQKRSAVQINISLGDSPVEVEGIEHEP